MPTTKPITIGDMTYDSLREASRMLGIPRSTLGHRHLPEAREVYIRYRRSPIVLALQVMYQGRHAKTAKGKATQRRYDHSAKGRARSARHEIKRRDTRWAARRKIKASAMASQVSSPAAQAPGEE